MLLIYYYYYSLWVFHSSISWWSFNGVCIQQVSLGLSRIFLSILIDLYNAVVWMALAHAPIFNSSSPLTMLLGTVPSAQIITGITIAFIFYNFFSSLARFKYVSLLIFFDFHFVVHRDGKVHYTSGSLFFFLFVFVFVLLSLGLVFWLGLGDLFVFKNLRIFCLSFSRTNSGLCIYHLVVCSNFNFLHYSLWITFPIQSSLVSCSLFVSLLHSVIIVISCVENSIEIRMKEWFYFPRL